MKYYPQTGSCQNCSCHIDQKVFDYSIDNYDFALCIPCQHWLQNKIEETTQETINLYFSLRMRGVPAALEKFDGHKTIDIAVVDAKVNIEVDGPQHNLNPKQAFSDLQRTFFAFKKGFFTLRIPNSLVRDNLQETADYITDLLVLSKERKYR